jgi:Concanavalin A-like lectin/glucanases superfamily
MLACLVFAAAAPADPPGLVGRYYLDGLIGASTPDSSGNGLNAVQVGAPAAIPDGRFGGAFRFGGITDGFAGDFAPLRPSTVTVAAWVRVARTPGPYQYVLSQGGTGCNYASYAFFTGPPEALGLRFYVWNGSAAVQSPAAPNTLWDGAWHLVTGTYDGVAVRLFVDAKEVGAGTPTAGPIVYGLADNRFAIGNYAQNVGTPPACLGSFSFMGDIDEVQVFHRALSAVEIASLMTHPSAGGDPPPPPPPPTPAAGPGRIKARLRMAWTVGPHAVTITSATLMHVPAGAKVRLVCRACRIKQTITSKRRTRTLARLRNERLRRGQKLTVTITKRGFIGRVITRKVRRYERTPVGIRRAARRPFTEKVRCIPVGATKPAKRC